MSSLIPSYESPFGPLTPIHQYILTNSIPITLSNFPKALLIPLIPLGIQAYLLQYWGTRLYRIGLGILGLQMVAHSWCLYRFDQPQHNAFNNGISIAFLHLSVKYIEFSLRKEVFVDPYIAKGRKRWIAAFDLCINSRMVWLGSPLGVNGSGRENEAACRAGENGNGELKEREGERPRRIRHLPAPNPSKTYSQSLIKHSTHALFHYTILDTLLSLIRHFGPETIGNPHQHISSISSFLSTTRFTILPNYINWVVPSWIVYLCIVIKVGVGVWQGLGLGYHVFALVAVGSTLWEVDSWEVDLFDQPWKADSLLDLWGRRWHQMFRHHFILISTVIVKLLHLPESPALFLPLIFTLSALLHVFGQISTDPVPHTPSIAGFFVLSGVGCALEVAFKRVTGKKVGGWSGRLWAWFWMLSTGGLAVGAWLDAGIGGAHLTPQGGIGDLVASLIVGTLVRAEQV